MGYSAGDDERPAGIAWNNATAIIKIQKKRCRNDRFVLLQLQKGSDRKLRAGSHVCQRYIYCAANFPLSINFSRRLLIVHNAAVSALAKWLFRDVHVTSWRRLRHPRVAASCSGHALKPPFWLGFSTRTAHIVSGVWSGIKKNGDETFMNSPCEMWVTLKLQKRSGSWKNTVFSWRISNFHKDVCSVIKLRSNVVHYPIIILIEELANTTPTLNKSTKPRRSNSMSSKPFW